MPNTFLKYDEFRHKKFKNLSIFKVWYLRIEFVCKNLSMDRCVELELPSKNILTSTHITNFSYYTQVAKIACRLRVYIVYYVKAH